MLKNFVVPCCRNRNPMTIRRMLRRRAVQIEFAISVFANGSSVAQLFLYTLATKISFRDMMARMRFALLLALATTLTASTLLASTEDDIKAAEKAWVDAVIARDQAKLQAIYTPDLIYAHSTGIIEDRAKYLDRLKSGVQRYDAITQESIKVVPHGDSAVTHSIVRMKGSTNKEPFDNHIMMIHVWVKQGGSWKLAAHQTTKLPN